MPVIFMEEKIMLEAEYEKEREKIEGKEDDRSEEELIQALQTIITSLQAPFYRKLNEKMQRKGEENIYTGKGFKVE